MTKYLCDRCGKEIENSLPIYMEKDTVIYKTKLRFPWGRRRSQSLREQNFEFCFACSEKFEAWMEWGRDPRGDME